MSHEEIQQMFREAQSIWKGEKWTDGMTQVFGDNWSRFLHNERYQDGEGGHLQIWLDPGNEKNGNILIRIPLTGMHEIRRWGKRTARP
jgi:hypothetical protein